MTDGIAAQYLTATYAHEPMRIGWRYVPSRLNDYMHNDMHKQSCTDRIFRGFNCTLQMIVLYLSEDILNVYGKWTKSGRYGF